MLPETSLQRFVRGLVGGQTAERHGRSYILGDGRRAAAVEIAKLIRSGAIAGSDGECSANTETIGWLKRARLDTDAFAAQHRVTVVAPDGTAINLTESPRPGSRRAMPPSSSDITSRPANASGAWSSEPNCSRGSP